MLLEECINSKTIIKEYNSLSIKYSGVDYKISIGDVFGRLTVIKLIRYYEGKIIRKGCICLCSCGNYIGPSRLVSLLNGDLLSCGCYSKESHRKLMISKNTKHGFSTRDNREHLYVLWGAMVDRATNTNRKDSKYYSRKNITICDEWRNDYLAFRNWSLNNGYKEGLSLDRIDNSLGYYPENCRWIEIKEQNSNKTNNRFLTYRGKTKTITTWGRELGLSWEIINNRLNKGLTVGQALGLEN